MFMKEYKGYAGKSVTIDGYDIYIKNGLLSEKCYGDDIVALEFVAPTLLKNGAIKISTCKGNYPIHFLKKSLDEFKELFDILTEKKNNNEISPDADPRDPNREKRKLTTKEIFENIDKEADAKIAAIHARHVVLNAQDIQIIKNDFSEFGSKGADENGKHHCSICGKEIGFMQKLHTSDGYDVCFTCYKCLVNPVEVKSKTLTLEQVKCYLQQSLQNSVDIKNFHTTRKVYDYLQIDEEQKKWFITPDTNIVPAIHSYSDIVSFELIQNNSQHSSNGSAIYGLDAVLNPDDAGGDIAMMLATNNSYCSNLQIGITIKSMLTPVVYINFIKFQTETNSSLYQKRIKEARECLAVLKLITSDVAVSPKAQESPTNNVSLSDQLRELKSLLDEEIISQEDFDQKKKQLLGLWSPNK